MIIKIKNYKNLKELDYSIDDNKINFLFGMSGSGKSSIVDAIASDDVEVDKTFGLSSSENIIVEVDGNVLSPTDVSVFNLDKMDFILESHDIEPVKEVILVNNEENKAVHKALETKLDKLNKAINSEISTYELYGSMLESLKAKKLTKNNKIPSSSPFAKLMTNIRKFSRTKLFAQMIAMDEKLLNWKLSGVSFINDSKCPFCEKKMNKKFIDKMRKISQFDSKNIGSTKEQLSNNSALLNIKLSYDLSEMEYVEKQLIRYSIAIRTFEHILKQCNDIFEMNYDYNSFERIKIPPEFKSLFPKTNASYYEFCKNISKVKSTIKKTQEDTDTFLKGKKKVINDIFELLGIPYYFDVGYHRSGPNEYSIVHLNDSNKEDDKSCMSNGERSLVSFVLFLVSSSTFNKKIIFIDDPISSFDSYRRSIVFELILKYLKGKTTIVISHDSIFAKYAISSTNKEVGEVSYISNNGNGKALIQSIKGVNIESFTKSIIGVCKSATGAYHKAILVRMLFEEKYGKNSHVYTYLSKILHGYDYHDIQSWILRKGKTEDDIINDINNELSKFGLRSYLTNLPVDYNKNIDISSFTIFEKCVILRELVSKNPSFYKASVKKELNTSVHLNEILAVSINVFEFPFISRTLYDEVCNIPTIISF